MPTHKQTLQSNYFVVPQNLISDSLAIVVFVGLLQLHFQLNAANAFQKCIKNFVHIVAIAIFNLKIYCLSRIQRQIKLGFQLLK